MGSLGALLLWLALLWCTPASCTIQLQPITRLAAFQANGSFVLNGPRTIAAGISANTTSIQVLQLTKGVWSLADVVVPPESDDAVTFLPGSVLLSTDGRTLAVAATPSTAAAAATSHTEELAVGYVYRVVAQAHSHKAFRFQLAGRLTLPVPSRRRVDSSMGTLTTAVDMSADGQTLLACWAQKSHQAAFGTQSGDGGAAVYSWKGFGPALHALQLPVPAGSRSFGQSCKLSVDGRTALLLDGSRGAMVYRREAHTSRGSIPAFRAAGWLAGAPAQKQYRVLSAGLSSEGKQAALLVQGTSSTGSYSALKVFAADSFGHWSEACSIPLQGPVEQSGTPQLSAFAGGVHVWAALGGAQLAYAVGLDGGAATHCPSQPVLATTQPTSGQTDAAHTAARRKTATASGGHILTGRLTVVGGDASAHFVSME